MFEPLFLHRESSTSALVDWAEGKGLKQIDVLDSASVIPRNNPAVIVYDGDLSILDKAPNRKLLMPPKGVGVVYLTGSWSRGQRGHVHGLPHPVEFLEWFLEEKLSFWDPAKGNFRTGYVQYFNAVAIG